MKTVVIIQARMGSSRFPGKMLKPLAGRAVIEWVFDRARAIAGPDAVVVATTVSFVDDPLVAFCHERKIPVYRGSENDVLDRYYQVAKALQADVVMRITGDCPLLDPRESGKVLKAFLRTPDCDYASNNTPASYPDGLDTEAVRFQTLEWMWKNTHEKPYREHVTYYVRSHMDKFRVIGVGHAPNLAHLRWTLDEAADYQLLSALAQELGERNQFGYLDEVLAILEAHPDLCDANKHIGRDEGLAKSLRETPLAKEG